MLFPTKITKENRINIPKKVINQFELIESENIYIYTQEKSLKITKNFMVNSDKERVFPSYVLTSNKDRTIRLSRTILENIGIRNVYYTEFANNSINIY